MVEKAGNIWEHWDSNRDWMVVLTNGSLKLDGSAIMDKGQALQAAEKFPTLPRELGIKIKKQGNAVHVFPQHGVITFPTKNEWHKPSDIKLIENSCITLANLFNSLKIRGNILIPRPGCGNGKLKWHDVRPIVELYLASEQFHVYNFS